MKERIPGVMLIREKRAVYLMFMEGASIEDCARKVGGLAWWGTTAAEQALRDYWTGKLKVPRWVKAKKKRKKKSTK